MEKQNINLIITFNYNIYSYALRKVEISIWKLYITVKAFYIKNTYSLLGMMYCSEHFMVIVNIQIQGRVLIEHIR